MKTHVHVDANTVAYW